MKDESELLHDRYARALYLNAEERGVADKVLGELEALSAEWLADRAFVTFLTHPLITPDEKKSVIEKLLKAKRCCGTMIDFLKVLIDNGREDLLHAVFLRYRDIYEESMRSLRVYVEAPVKVGRREKALLTKALRSKFSARKAGKINMEIKENPGLIGGLFVKYQDRIYDFSAKGHLDNLKKAINR